jgi:cytochrome d ubiquinol oxidase subunit I
VAFGTTLSAFWILALNAWMQTPAGHEMIAGKAHAVDWWLVIFNPSFPWRLVHMLMASGLTVAFLVAGLSAWRYLRGDRGGEVMSALRTGVALAALLAPAQILVGDLLGLNTLEHQPAKIAAMEGLWHTEKGAPLVLFAWPDEQARANRYALEVPKGASLILKHELEGEVRGLNEFEGDHPPVAPVFWSFRIMVGVGVLMLALAWWAGWQLWRRRDISRVTARALVAMTFSGWVATLAGWYVTEIGRQPWLVQGVLKTADAAGPISQPMLASTLAMYLALYAALLAAYVSVLFYMAGHAGKAQAEPPVSSPSLAEASERKS